jgi:hypothetical protein
MKNPTQEHDVFEIDMVNNTEQRERINNIWNAMCDAVPADATNPEVATACFIVLAQIAGFHRFNPLIIEDLKSNLDASLQQAEVQWKAQDAARRGLSGIEVQGHG